MAFPNRVADNLLKKNVSKHFSSLFQAIRCKSLSAATKLSVEDLPLNTDEDDLREEFAQYGSVLEVRIVMDREADMFWVFGFVTYNTREVALNAIKAFGGKYYKGMYPRVSFSAEKPPLGYRKTPSRLWWRDGGYSGYGGGDNYSGRDGNYGGDSSYGGGNQLSDGGGYGGYDDSLHGGGGGGGNYSGNKQGFASLLNNDTSGAVGREYDREEPDIDVDRRPNIRVFP